MVRWVKSGWGSGARTSPVWTVASFRRSTASIYSNDRIGPSLRPASKLTANCTDEDPRSRTARATGQGCRGLRAPDRLPAADSSLQVWRRFSPFSPFLLVLSSSFQASSSIGRSGSFAKTSLLLPLNAASRSSFLPSSIELLLFGNVTWQTARRRLNTGSTFFAELCRQRLG